MAGKKKSRKANKKLKEKLMYKINYWLTEATQRFRLTNWSLTTKFESDMEVDSDTETEQTMLEVACLPDYMEAVINVNVKACLEISDNQLRKVCYHEIAHVLLSNLTHLAESRWVTENEFQNEQEKVCQILAQVVGGK